MVKPCRNPCSLTNEWSRCCQRMVSRSRRSHQERAPGGGGGGAWVCQGLETMEPPADRAPPCPTLSTPSGVSGCPGPALLLWRAGCIKPGRIWLLTLCHQLASYPCSLAPCAPLLPQGLSSLLQEIGNLPDGSDGKESACQCRRHRFNPWVRKIPREKEMATHSSILPYRIPWTEEPGRLQSMGSQRVSHK